jgi:hypothetical protein
MSNKKIAGEKKLFASSAAYILGLSPVQKIKGSVVQIESYQKVLLASKILFEALKNNESSEKIISLIQEKKDRARVLYHHTGLQWPF